MTVLDEANTAAVRMMLSKLAEHEVTEVYETVGQVGPIADLAERLCKSATSTSRRTPAVHA